MNTLTSNTMPNEVKESYSNLVNALCINNSCSDEYKDVSQRGSCGKNGPPSTILSFCKGLGLGSGFLVRSFHMIPQRYSVPACRHRPQPILLKRVRDKLKMSDFPPNCMRFVVYRGVRIINAKYTEVAL